MVHYSGWPRVKRIGEAYPRCGETSYARTNDGDTHRAFKLQVVSSRSTERSRDTLDSLWCIPTWFLWDGTLTRIMTWKHNAGDGQPRPLNHKGVSATSVCHSQQQDARR